MFDSTTLRLMSHASDSVQRYRAFRADSLRTAADVAAHWVLARHDLVLVLMAFLPSAALVLSVYLYSRKQS